MTFFIEEFSGKFSLQALVQPPQTRTRSSGRARQKFQKREPHRERAMMHMEVTKAAEEWRRTRLRAQSEQDLNRMLEQLGFDDWRVICR